MWFFNGSVRPPFAKTPRAGEESVWDYPRPPMLAADDREIIVAYRDQVIARSTKAIRVLETAGPPTFYLPKADIDFKHLVPALEQSWCEWKGSARYYRLANSDVMSDVVSWTYPRPNDNFEALQDCFGFYPGRLQCSVNGESVRAQAGGFYAGWVTNEIVGPMKGEPGTEWW